MKRYFLSVAMIVRDEEMYLPEFLEHHLLQGIEHFYIYEHEPNGTRLLKILETYIKQDVVTYDIYHGDRPQLKVYREILDRYGDETEWLAVIDCDELIVPNNSEYSLKQYLELMPENIGAYALHWCLYGSSGHKFKTPGLVIERFTKREKGVNKHVKSIVRPALVESAGRNPHCFYLAPGAIATRGYLEANEVLPREYAMLENGMDAPFRINHYHTKSELEYRKRKINPAVSSGHIYTPEKVDEMFKAHDKNELTDICAAVFAEEIKKRLKHRGLLNE